jgi:hypothetical protein
VRNDRPEARILAALERRVQIVKHFACPGVGLEEFRNFLEKLRIVGAAIVQE